MARTMHIRLFVLMCSLFWGAGFVATAEETFDHRVRVLMAHAIVVKPEGPGPFPVVLQMHGCGGRKSFQKTWADVAREAGYAAIVVDSYAHRGISRLGAYSTVCTGARLWGRERAGDVYAALAWARAQPWADRRHMVVAGWSHGGWTALDALALKPGAEMASATGLRGLPEEPLDGVTGAFLVYPWCSFGCIARHKGLRYDAKPLALVGSKDAVVGSNSLRATLEALAAPTQVRALWLDGATHAFDEPDAKDLRVRYNPEAVATAHAAYIGYLAEARAR